MTDRPPLLIERLADHARHTPKRAALWSAETQLDFEQLWSAISAAAGVLRSMNVGQGDRVAIQGPNHPAVAVAYFATHAVGATAVPIGPDLNRGSVREIIETCRPTLCCTTDEGAEAGWHSIASWARQSEAQAELAVEVGPEHTADLLFTTGTTGKKKGVLLSQANVAAAARNILGFLPVEPGDVEVVPIPLSHSFGLGRLRCLAEAGHCLVLGALQNPAALLKLMLSCKATGLAIVPAGVGLLKKTVAPFVPKLAEQLRYIELGSAPIDPELESWLVSALPETRIVHHYGMTEVSRAVFRDVRDHPASSSKVGQPSPLCRIRIRAESGQEAEPGEVGEVEATGPMMFQAYWDDEALTRATQTDDGWVRTGDLGSLDEEGLLSLMGRKNDVINVGGLKVAPEEVERELRRLPGVEEAACVGVPDPGGILGSVVKAFVVVSSEDFDPGASLQALRTTLVDHQLPRSFEVVDEIPKTSSGKLQRAKLRGPG
ncbi:MAG: class I adenylate-forming enzyme family protein [Myxococcota bacterium]